jgi:hypothetical protein
MSWNNKEEIVSLSFAVWFSLQGSAPSRLLKFVSNFVRKKTFLTKQNDELIPQPHFDKSTGKFSLFLISFICHYILYFRGLDVKLADFVIVSLCVGVSLSQLLCTRVSKITKKQISASSCLSVRLPAWGNLAVTRRIFYEMWHLSIFSEMCCEKKFR